MQKFSRMVVGCIFSVFAISQFSMVSAQNINLRGKITTKDGKPVSNAIVMLKRQTLTDTTGLDGMYSIKKNIVKVLPALIPASTQIRLNRGILELTLEKSSPVKIELFDLIGNLLTKEELYNVPAGNFYWNIMPNHCSNTICLIRASIGQHVMTYRYLAEKNMNYLISSSTESSVLATGLQQAKAGAVLDTLQITAGGFKTILLALSTFDTTVNITLDSNGTCAHVVLKGNNILTIGDSWIEMPFGNDNQVVKLLNHLKVTGVLAANENADRREKSGATLDQIISQYNSKSNSNVKILIMDGGGIDLFSTPVGSQAQIDAVVKKFKDFLQKVKTDGYVEHIIYSLYPVIPTTPNLNVNMKPGFSDACTKSPVDCHLVDLEPLFKGQHFASDRTHSDAAGATIIADAWWKAMKEYCIAQ